MKFHRLLLSICILLISASRSFADGEIALPLRVRTFPELAQTLSASGRTVVCPPAFSQRVVLIHLDNRNWDTARTLLQSGLGIRFRRLEDKPDTWTMESDAALDSRYDRWLMKLAELTVLAARESVADSVELASMPYEDAIRTFMRAEIYRRSLEVSDPEMETEEALNASIAANAAEAVTYYPTYYGARMALRLRTIDVYHAMKAGQRLQPVDVGPLHLSPVVRESIEYKLSQIRMELRQSGEDNEALMRAVTDRFQELITTPWRVSARLDFDTLSAGTRGQIVTQSAQHGEGVTGFSADPVQDRWTEVIAKLGQDAAEWLAQDEAARAQLMKDPAATKPVRLEKGFDLSSLSQWLEVWAGQNSAEIVMELQPGRETIAAIADGEGIPVAFPPVPARKGSGLPSTLAETMATTQPGALWSVRRTDGVWMFTNRQRFVDRLRECPSACLIALEKHAFDPTERALPKYRLADLAAFHQSITPEQSASLGTLFSYRGMDLTTIATARPAVQILASLSQAQRDRIASELRVGKTFDVPLSTLSPLVLNSIAASMREMALSPRGYAVPDSTLTDFATQSLRRLSLHLRHGDDKSHMSVISAFILSNPTPLDIAEDHLEVELRGLLDPK